MNVPVSAAEPLTNSTTSLCHEWGLAGHAIVSEELPLRALSFSAANEYCEISHAEVFDHQSCRMLVAPHGAHKGRIKIRVFNPNLRLRGIEIVICRAHPSITINVGGNNVRVYMGCIGYAFVSTMNLWADTSVCIGDGCTSNGATIVTANSDVIVQRDCMFSSEVFLQSSDQHGIVDAVSGALLNGGRRQIVLGEHVWMGRRTMILPDVRVGGGSIIAAGAVVTSDVPACSIVGGVPAKVLRQNCTWSRDPAGLSAVEKRSILRLRQCAQ
jgi:acetyltransferase-like isoleucine patch superfamily enzyme